MRNGRKRPRKEWSPPTYPRWIGMPMIIHGAVEDLRSKRVSISLLGDAEQTEIKLFLRVMEYDEFLARFYPDTALSASGMCLIAGAKKTEEDA
eukprot:COSAG04_NODE_23171_length_342_cov_1.901235_1_plen_92_part_10